jgi:hypothetical protein
VSEDERLTTVRLDGLENAARRCLDERQIMRMAPQTILALVAAARRLEGGQDEELTTCEPAPQSTTPCMAILRRVERLERAQVVALRLAALAPTGGGAWQPEGMVSVPAADLAELRDALSGAAALRALEEMR